jgi:hypothetical protein
MAAGQVALLNSGRIRYICIDRRFRGADASNCTHAVTDLDTTQAQLNTGTQSGNAASEAALQHLSRWIIPAEVSNYWLVKRLKLNRSDVRLASTEAAPARISR